MSETNKKHQEASVLRQHSVVLERRMKRDYKRAEKSGRKVSVLLDAEEIHVLQAGLMLLSKWTEERMNLRMSERLYLIISTAIPDGFVDNPITAWVNVRDHLRNTEKEDVRSFIYWLKEKGASFWAANYQDRWSEFKASQLVGEARKEVVL